MTTIHIFLADGTFFTQTFEPTQTLREVISAIETEIGTRLPAPAAAPPPYAYRRGQTQVFFRHHQLDLSLAGLNFPAESEESIHVEFNASPEQQLSSQPFRLHELPENLRHEIFSSFFTPQELARQQETSKGFFEGNATSAATSNTAKDSKDSEEAEVPRINFDHSIEEADTPRLNFLPGRHAALDRVINSILDRPPYTLPAAVPTPSEASAVEDSKDSEDSYPEPTAEEHSQAKDLRKALQRLLLTGHQTTDFDRILFNSLRRELLLGQWSVRQLIHHLSAFLRQSTNPQPGRAEEAQIFGHVDIDLMQALKRFWDNANSQQRWAMGVEYHRPLVVELGFMRQTVFISHMEFDDSYYTKLHVAAYEGCTEEVKRLLEGETTAQTNQVDLFGQTPLHVAANRGHTGVAKLLLQAGVQANQADIDGGTPLHSAAYRGHATMVELLLQTDAEVNQTDVRGEIPLHIAARRGDTTVIALLLAARAQIERGNNYGITSLHHAVQGGHTAAVELLLAAGARVERGNNYGMTSLHYAALEGHEAVVVQLLQMGARVDQTDQYDNTPLHDAALGGHEAMVAQLLEAKAQVDPANEDGKTPLYFAAEGGHTAVVVLLLQMGARVDQADNDGRTPLSIAKKLDRHDIIKLLTAADEAQRSAAAEGKREEGPVTTSVVGLSNDATAAGLFNRRSSLSSAAETAATPSIVPPVASQSVLPVTDSAANEEEAASEEAVAEAVGPGM